jgi:hypothetical protein
LLLFIVAVLSSLAAAKPPTTKNKDDFKACGGAKKCLGVARLERIRRKSGVDHKSVDAIAAQIDEDGDLVSNGCLFALISTASCRACIYCCTDGTSAVPGGRDRKQCHAFSHGSTTLHARNIAELVLSHFGR